MKTMWKYNAMPQAKREECESFRKQYSALKAALDTLPACRERSLALTHLEDSFLRVEQCILLFEPEDQQAG